MSEVKVNKIINRLSATSVKVDRTTSDGAIIELQKDGTTVGSINAKDGDIAIGTNDTALRFSDSTASLYPFNNTTNGGRDNAIDLGLASVRWQDLYLGGNIYLGGTGSTNALDDYEEGTFTVGVDYGTITNTTGHYTKIGNQVTVRLNPQSFSDRTTNAPVKLSGFPFQCFSTYAGGVMNRHVNVSTKPQIVWYMGNNYDYVFLFACGTNGDWQQVQHDDLDASNAEFYITATYFTNS